MAKRNKAQNRAQSKSKGSYSRKKAAGHKARAHHLFEAWKEAPGVSQRGVIGSVGELPFSKPIKRSFHLSRGKQA